MAVSFIESSRPGGATVKTVIRNADWVITMDPDRRLVRDGALVIVDDRIVEVGRTADIGEAADADRIIDARGMVVTPGLIDGHCHNMQHLCRGLANECDIQSFLYERLYPYESSLTHEEAYLSARFSQLELVKSGTTCVVDPGSYFPDAMVRALGESGMRGIVARSTFDIPASSLGTIPSKVFEESIDEALAQSEQFVHSSHGMHDGRVTASLQLRVLPNCSDELCREVKALAEMLGVGFQAHASFAKEVYEASKLQFGKSDVARLHDLGCLGPNLLLAHAGWLTPTDMQSIHETQTPIALCATSSTHQAMGILSHGHTPELLAMGVTVCLGTDGGPHGTNDLVRQMFLASAGFKEIRLDATIMSPETMLEMATLHGATAAGLADEIGSLEPGKKADVVLFDAQTPEWRPLHDPVANLVYCANGNTADTVLVDGRVLMENRAMVFVDEARIIADGQRASEEIARRCGLDAFATPKWPILGLS
jgi:5-methylthioadenosine/S-adenosylhomocysteine deaminase